MSRRAPTSETFFVGYLPMPARLRPALLAIAVLLVSGMASLGALFAAVQDDPGPGEWRTDALVTLTGVVVMDPYPMLRTVDAEGRPQAYLLVEEGKFGAQRRAVALAGLTAELRGYPIEREGLLMLELISGAAASGQAAASAAVPEAPVSEPLGQHTLRGEIVDAKCFLGVMKPGFGKAHKACASLCVLGGIPPMLITRREDGSFEYLLVTAPDGGPATDPRLHDLIADPIAVSGDVERRDGLLIIRADLETAERLPPL